MKYNTELKVSKPLFDNDPVNITEEYFFRKLAVDTINGIPFDELSKLFKFKKIDPFSDESTKIMIDPREFWIKQKQIEMLKQKNVILFEASLNI